MVANKVCTTKPVATVSCQREIHWDMVQSTYLIIIISPQTNFLTSAFQGYFQWMLPPWHIWPSTHVSCSFQKFMVEITLRHIYANTGIWIQLMHAERSET